MLVLFVFFMWVVFWGMKLLKVVGFVVGIVMFIMLILYVVMVVIVLVIINVEIVIINIIWQLFIFYIDFIYIIIIFMLVFVVGGVEKILFYVNQMWNSGKEFLKGMFFLVVMVVVCVIFGLLVMGMMFDFWYIFDDLMING